ncbi:glycoside hydrolase family 2 protein [Anaerosporobacter sp.]|uniref:glycoside hydrolase family 2 protein n=1 Tax=Anaerosporobacter sp. TaxID=1872529 RepID=UPI00286F8749|nr:glycoside hydrolase family 2 TIM barrel-domain containing protein [Anaerosporobacter sp.]
MIRTFSVHNIRTQQELTGRLWEFSPCQGELVGKRYQVATPSCWESYPDFTGYRGEGIYKTTFHAGGNIRLEFKGVSHTATVYLDGKEIVSHYNAYTIFSTVVKEVEEGNHVLEIKADNRFSEASALHIPNDYMAYGGVSRPVVLEQISNVYIQWIHVTPSYKDSSWNAKIELKLENIDEFADTFDARVKVAGKEVVWNAIKIDGQAEMVLEGEINFTDVKTWTMEEPELYYVTATIEKDGDVIDDYIDRFGFREVGIEGKNILLNGRSIRLKGVCRHEDHPQFACALPYSAMAADLDIIKHLGANSVRTSHYPNDEIFLDLCDEQGILIWEENHARGLSLEDMKNPNFEPQAEQVIREMIPLHYNHPSIYIWGILNECASDSEYGKECYEKQLTLIKELDTSRPHSFASCKFKTDLCFGLPDVVSYNIYPLWYHDTKVEEYLDDLYQWVQNETDGVGKPFLITEIGAGGLYGYRNAYKSKWTEEYQAEALEKQMTAVLNYADCCGIYIWQFCDIRISDEWFGGRPRTMNNKGIVDEYRRRKLSYDVVKQIFESYGNYM